MWASLYLLVFISKRASFADCKRKYYSKNVLCIFSPGFQRFVNVLVKMSGDERKSFLQFTTGCSSLPPGGLANLQPRLTGTCRLDSFKLFPIAFISAKYFQMANSKVLNVFNIFNVSVTEHRLVQTPNTIQRHLPTIATFSTSKL